jgi:hypothetical protein
VHSDIRPDLTGDVPRCSTECPRFRYQGWGSESTCGDGGDFVHREHDLCLVRVREDHALSKRRCDGCRNWTRSNEYQTLGFCRVSPDEEGPAWGEDSFCSVWEAKP